MRSLFFIPLLGMLLMFSGCAPEPEIAEEPGVVDRVQVAIMLGEGFHDGEAYMPYAYLTNLGAEITVIGPEVGTVTAYNTDFTINIQRPVADVSVDEFDALILPGGQAPAKIRENEAVVAFAREFFESGKPVAAICHGPQILITAGVMEGKNATGFEDIKGELEEAGATFHDEAVVIDGNLITSRTPPDLYDFSKAIEEKLMMDPAY